MKVWSLSNTVCVNLNVSRHRVVSFVKTLIMYVLIKKIMKQPF